MSERVPGLPPAADAKPETSRGRIVVRVVVIVMVVIFFLIGLSSIELFTSAWSNAEKQELAVAEGASFGAQNTDQACLDETIRRVRTSDAWLMISERGFLQACLEDAKVSSTFCAGVPVPSDGEAGLEWRLAQCESQELGLEDANCGLLYWPIQSYCVERKEARGVAE